MQIGRLWPFFDQFSGDYFAPEIVVDFEEGLKTYLTANPAIAALIGSRVYPYYVPRDVQTAGYPCIVYTLTESPVESVTGQSGAVTAVVDLECWAPTFGAACSVAAAVRKAMQGYRGAFDETVGVAGSWFVGMEDDCEQPADDSTTYWHCRTMTFDVTYHVPRHTF